MSDKWHFTAPEEIDLKPCPFCGPGQSKVTLYQDEYMYWIIGCGRCGSHSGIRPVSDPDGRQKIVDLWNTRPGRSDRQQTIAWWCAAAFGQEHASSIPQRGVRLLEEAVEAYQASGGDVAMAHKLVEYVFAHQPGKLSQEIGGIGITLLALANAAGCNADEEEQREADRVLSKSLEHFRQRNQTKNEAGFNVTPREGAA